MSKRKFLAIVGIVVVGSTFYFVMRIGKAQQSAIPAPDSHSSCLPTKDYPNSNGYTESYTRPNTCHSKKVMFYQGPYYRINNGWRARCPANATLYVHSRAHYMMSPTLDGDYDGGAGGGAHYYCLDGSGNQVDPVPGESESNPFHTHTFDGLAKVDVVDSDTDYYYSYKTSQWVSCQGGYQGPFSNSAGSVDAQYGNFNNHFHCKNPNYAVGSAIDNPEATPTVLSTPPQTSLVGSFSTSDSGTKDQFVDKGPWGATAPLGTLSCVHTNSDKVYFSTTGTCPAASQFPLKPTYSFELTKIDAPIEAKIGATAWIKFKLKNNSTAQIDFPVYCDSGNGSFLGNMYYLNPDGTIGEKFVNPGAYPGSSSLPSANAVIAAGVEKNFQFKFDIPASVAVRGPWTGKCHTYPKDNATGNSLTDKKQEITNILTVIAVDESTTTVSATALTQYGTNKYSIKVEDADGLKEFSVKTLGTTTNLTGRSIYGGSPGAAGNVGACSGTNSLKSLDSGTVTIESNEWPLNFSVTDCKANVKTGNVSMPGGTVPVPGAGAPEPSSNEVGVWAQVEISTGQIVNTVVCTRSVCGLNGEYHGYVPPPTFSTGSVWWPTSKRYIWQLQGDAGYSPGTFDFNTYIFTVSGGTIYNGKFTPTTPPLPGTSTTPTSCKVGEKCSKGSFCQSGMQCYYPDSQLTCVAWNQNTSTPASSPTKCSSGTSPCNPTEANCVAPGQIVDYSTSGPAGSKWCGGGGVSQYYSKDGTKMACVYSDETPPAGFSACRPGDSNCRQKGDKWIEKNDSLYCMNAQKCTLATGGGNCVGLNESCPAGTKYCSTNDTNCIEPDSYKSLSPSQLGSYWCGGGGGMAFYSATQAYCPPKRTSSTGPGMMWTGVEVKEILAKLGAGFGLCNKTSSNMQSQCIEPGQTGPSNGWCAWSPPNSVGPAMTPSSSVIPVRTCPSLDGETAPPPQPPGPPIDEKHKNCSTTMYFKKNGYYVDEKGNPAPSFMPRPGYTTEFKFIDDHYHLCSTPDGTKPICSQVITRAYNPKTNECQDFKDSCIPDGWIAGECPGKKPVPPGEIPECKPGESPFPDPRAYSLMPVCRMPMYRWAILEKKWEKCDSSNMPPYVNVKDNPKATHTNCQSFGNFDIEREWLSERFLAHDPRVDGEWYMPQWDAALEMFRYSPKTDQLEQCSIAKETLIMMPVRPGEYMSPCMPAPEKDRGWLLKKGRAEYKMWQLWNTRKPEPVPPKPGEPPAPEPVLPPVPPVPEIPPAQCKGYMTGIRQQLAGAKQFWKDVRNNLNQVLETYSDAKTVSELLAQAKSIIAEADQLVRAGKCSSDTLTAIQKKLTTLHSEIFPQLSSYLPEIQDFADYQQCRMSLAERIKQLKGLEKNNLDKDTKSKLADLLKSIESKLKEFEVSAGDFTYDANFECREFNREVESKIAPLLLITDAELNRIIEDVVNKQLEPVLEKLSIQMEERGKKIDELLVQVANLHKALEEVTVKAAKISEQIAVSYSAFTKIEEQFVLQKAEIQAAKDRLIPLVEQATKTMQETQCLSGVDQERIAQEFGTLASVHWFGENATEIEKRLNVFIANCSGNDVKAADVLSFATNVQNAAKENLEAAYKDGLTPFVDVPTHEWYYGDMKQMHDLGWMTQGRPAESALAQDALLMVLRAAELDNITGNCTLKAPGVNRISPYAVCAANTAYEKGLELQGNMQAPVDRIKIAEWITVLKPNLPKLADDIVDFSAFADIGRLANGTRFVAYMYVNGIMVGDTTADGKRYFRPYDPLTRAALAVILDKVRAVQEGLER